MDTTRDIIYRDYKLNDSQIAAVALPDGLGQGIAGCVVTDFDPDDVDVVQFSEKRAEADGLDVGDPFLGGRRIRINGTVYGKTRALAYDSLFDLRRVLNPVLAAREIPGDKGYLPLYFAVPTNDTTNFPAGTKEMRALVMPRSFRAPISRDEHGGEDSDALSFNWGVSFSMRSPNFEGETPQDFQFPDTTGTFAGNFLNRGTYSSPLNMIFSVGTPASTITVAAGGSIFTIAIPLSTANRIIRIKREKLITVEENGVEAIRRSWLTFNQSTTWPMMPPGTSAYSVTVTGGPLDPGSADGSHMWFWETYA
jgi:hypothetical protein